MRNCLKFIINFLCCKSAVILRDGESVLLVFGSQVQQELLHLVVANFGEKHFNCLSFHQQGILRLYCFRLAQTLVTKSSLNFMLFQFYPLYISERTNTISVLSSYRILSSTEFSRFCRLACRIVSIDISCSPYILHTTLIALSMSNHLKTEKRSEENTM